MTSKAPTITTERGSWIWVGLLCLPVLGSLLASVGTARTLPAVVGPPRPALIFDRYHANLQSVEFEPQIEAHYVFENHGGQPVKITKVEPSCGCLIPKVVTLNGKGGYVDCQEFAPGQVGVVALGIRPAKEQPGLKEMNAVVHYFDGQPRTETLVFQVNLPKKKLTVSPNEVYFYQVSGEADRRTVEVSDFRDQPANIVSVSVLRGGKTVAPFEALTARLSEPTVGPDGERRWSVEIECAPHVKEFRQEGWLVVTTDDPKLREVRVPVVLFGEQPDRTAIGPAPAQK